MQNSTRCLKASTQNCKIEAFKLVGEVKRISKTSPLQNSTRCLKASTQNCKIEAFKLVGEVKRISKNFALAPCRALFI
ncbi:conserved hypothetical protein [Treponema phagedenis]|uniref:Uncharacterized protein n=1 Tax=Treponema phagedenis TaxID=162 RepID=A0A0B7GX32_TREPH|nr:conserved hypothetical protein [Treponema phagedenis]